MDRAAVAAIAALDDDVRRALYEYVRDAGEPVTRQAAADAVGISRKLAAFHLDKLVDLELLRLDTGGDRPRRVGRTPLRYAQAGAEMSVRLPERTPEVLAAILVESVTHTRRGESARSAARRVAQAHGVDLGAEARRRHARPGRLGVERASGIARQLLADAGFEPYPAADGTLRLRNCPFHALARQEPEFVCGLNREYLDGVLTGLGATTCLTAELAPRAGECCVELRPTR